MTAKDSAAAARIKGMTITKMEWPRLLSAIDDSTMYRVAMVIWTFTNADGTNAYPGHSRIASECTVTKATAKRWERQLLADGWIILEEPGGTAMGPGGRMVTRANRYRLGPGPAAPGVTSDPGVIGEPGVTDEPFGKSVPPGVAGDPTRGHGRPHPGSPVTPPRDHGRPHPGVTDDPPTDHEPDHEQDPDKVMTTSAPTGRDRDAIASAPQVLEGDVLPPADDREPEDVEGTLERLDGNFEDEFGYGLEDHEVRTARGILGSITDPRKAYQVTRNTIARDRREGVTA